MKLIVSTAVALLLAGQAFAGALVFEAPEEPAVIAEPAPMGGQEWNLKSPKAYTPAQAKPRPFKTISPTLTVSGAMVCRRG